MAMEVSEWYADGLTIKEEMSAAQAGVAVAL
jgi:hypothetical protein